MKKKVQEKKKKSFSIFSVGSADRPAIQKDADDFKKSLDTGKSIVRGEQVSIINIDNSSDNVQYIFTIWNYGGVAKKDQISGLLKLIEASEITGQNIVVPYCVYINSIYRG